MFFISGIMVATKGILSRIADRAADSARDGLESLQQGYAAAERVVQERPGQVVAMAFGLGLVAGLGTVLLLREKRRDSTCFSCCSIKSFTGIF